VAVFLHGWPHEALGDELGQCLDSGMAKGMQGFEYLAAERERDVGCCFAVVSQYSSTEVPGIRSSSCKALVLTRSDRSLSSFSWAAASGSCVTGAEIASTRESAWRRRLGQICGGCRELGDEVQMVKLAR